MIEAPLAPGQVLSGRFEIERRVGGGGMGDVYRAHDRELGRSVAIKTLRVADDDGERRFLREATVLFELSHPHIVRYEGHGRTDDGGLYLAMEWLEGEDLAAHLTRGPLDEETTRALGRRVAEAIAHAHARGVVHRDLKPGNIVLLGGDPTRPKLVDFGIARASNRTLLTRAGGIVGTPGYMAPEQARGEPGLDGRADLFSLGCVLFECVTGRAAFVAQSALALLFKILVEDPPSPAELRPGLSHDLSRLIATLLEKLPARRPRDANEVARQLAEARITPGPGLTPPTTREGLTDAEQRLACVIVAAGVARESARPEDELAATLGATLVEGPREPLRQIAAALGARVQWLADGGLIAVVAGGGSAGDQGSIAARCALAFHDALPGETFALAIGRAELRGAVPLGPVVDRAVALLHRSGPRARPDAGVLVDETAAQLLSARFEIAAGHLIEPRALPTPGRTLLGRATPLVGRDRERARIVQVAEACVLEREAQALLILGPAGIGKSRLLAEALADVATRAPDLVVWAAGADPVGGRAPLAILLDAVRRGAGIVPREARASALEKLERTVPSSSTKEQRADLDAFFREVLGGDGASDGTMRLDPALRAEPIRRGFLLHVEHACARHPVAIVLEDLHWSDAASLRFLDEALAALVASPLLVLGVARPELRDTHPRLWSSHRLEEVHLPLLRAGSAGALARHALGDVDEAVIARIVQRSTGNPFYLEELIRAVAAGRGDALPETVIAMALERLEVLDPSARRLLRAASVYGEVFQGPALMTLLEGSGLDRTELDRSLELLVAEEVITRDPEDRTGSLHRFRHAYLRDAAYSMLTDADRALGHRLAGEWLERAGGEEPSVVAEHYQRAGDARAATWFLAASRKAGRRSDPDGAIELAARGLASGPDGRTREELLRSQIGTYSWRGDFRRVLDLSSELLGASEPGSRSWWSPIVTALYAAVFLGRPGPTRTSLRAIEQTAPQLDALPAYGRALSAALPVMCTASAHAAVASLYPVFRANAEPLAERDPFLRGLLDWIASYHALSEEDDPWKALTLARAAAPALEKAGDTQRSLQVHGEIAVYLGDLGDLEAHDRENRRVWPLTSHMGLGPSIGLGYLTYNLAEHGRTSAAREVAGWIFERTCASGFSAGEGTLRAGLANVLLRTGDAQTAELEARRAVRLTATVPRYAALGLTALVRARLALGRPEAALRASRAAIRYCGRFHPIGPTEAGVYLAHVEALRANGEHTEASQALEVARACLSLRAARILDAAARATYLASPCAKATFS